MIIEFEEFLWFIRQEFLALFTLQITFTPINPILQRRRNLHSLLDNLVKENPFLCQHFHPLLLLVLVKCFVNLIFTWSRQPPLLFGNMEKRFFIATFY